MEKATEADTKRLQPKVKVFWKMRMTILCNQPIPETVTTLAASDGHHEKSKMAFSWASSPTSGSIGVGYKAGMRTRFWPKKTDPDKGDLKKNILGNL